VISSAETLSGRGYQAEPLHGGMSQEQRDRVMGRMRAGSAVLLVATDVAARGLDLDQLSHVVNYDVPAAPESYVHRVGRVGRAGRAGVAITLVEPRERHLLGNIERLTAQPIALATVPTVADLRARRIRGTLDRLRAALVGGSREQAAGGQCAGREVEMRHRSPRCSWRQASGGAGREEIRGRWTRGLDTVAGSPGASEEGPTARDPRDTASLVGVGREKARHPAGRPGRRDRQRDRAERRDIDRSRSPNATRSSASRPRRRRRHRRHATQHLKGGRRPSVVISRFGLHPDMARA
jgi:superfamily II DNA/RNA helicase